MKQASRVADERCPLPAHTPATAAALGAMAGFLVVTLFMNWQGWIGLMAASILTITLCALVAFLDSRQKWNRHAQIEVAELKRLREQE